MGALCALFLSLITSPEGEMYCRNNYWGLLRILHALKCCRLQLKCDGTRWHTGREVKGILGNGVIASTLHTTSEHGVSSITTADAHTSAASSRLKWRPCRFKWTRPFRRKTNFGFCACAITFQTQSTVGSGWRLEEEMSRDVTNRCSHQRHTESRTASSAINHTSTLLGSNSDLRGGAKTYTPRNYSRTIHPKLI